MKRILFAVLFFCVSALPAQEQASLGLIAFRIEGEQIVVEKQTGIFRETDPITFTEETGKLNFHFEAFEDDRWYQVGLSNLGVFTVWSVNRKPELFELRISKLVAIENGHELQPYEPNELCIVTVER